MSHNTCDCLICAAIKMFNITEEEEGYFRALVDATEAANDIYADADEAGLDLCRPEIEEALDSIFQTPPELPH